MVEREKDKKKLHEIGKKPQHLYAFALSIGCVSYSVTHDSFFLPTSCYPETRYYTHSSKMEAGLEYNSVSARLERKRSNNTKRQEKVSRGPRRTGSSHFSQPFACFKLLSLSFTFVFRYWYRKVFVYYKNLIDFRQRGTPVTLLRSINPAEAQLAEAAAGLHVRFRLGGSVFPPLIFYKIYTHRPVTDICSFAPRDYVGERKPKPRVNIEGDFTIPEELLECFHLGGKPSKRQDVGWYMREDANGWRPIAER